MSRSTLAPLRALRVVALLAATPAAAGPAPNPSAVIAPTPPPASTAAAAVITSPSDGTVVPGGAELPVVLRLPAGARGVVTRVAIDGAEVTPGTGVSARGIVAPGAAPAGADANVVQLRVPIPSPPGDYHVEIAIDGAAPLRLHVVVAAPGASTPRSRIVLLAVGVSRYARSDLSLRYPAKDARNIAEVFTGQTGLLYSEVKSRVLVDASATRGQILDGLRWVKEEARASDVVLLFLAGHGIHDGATDSYYFLPHDADPGKPRQSMVSQDELRGALAALPGKVLVLLDTCFSGGLLDGERARSVPAAASLSAVLAQTEGGVVVLSSATAGQTALEGDSWENGAFTRALVEGLRGGAVAPDGDQISLMGLAAFVSNRVKGLTGDRQTPTLAMPTSMADFPVAVATDQRGVLPPESLVPPPASVRPWVWVLVGVSAAVVVAGVVTAAVLIAGQGAELPVVTPAARF